LDNEAKRKHRFQQRREDVMARGQGIEQELLHLLRHGGLQKDNLAALVKIIAGFHEKGLNHIKVFPKGIPPVYEGLGIKSIIEAGRLNNLLTVILNEAQVNSVVVFPYGVPVFDAAEVVVGLGPTPVGPGPAGVREAAE